MKPEIDTMKVITYDDEKKFILRLSDIIADYQHKKLEVEVQYSFYNGWYTALVMARKSS